MPACPQTDVYVIYVSIVFVEGPCPNPNGPIMLWRPCVHHKSLQHTVAIAH